ncbi:MAG TPA: hypothetical protein VMV52_09390 [Candidatus Nanopelagicaceae bacterium]|nr:hypothetical protein [Candidatus Nanopelagicaceae bacterium]
MFFDFGSGELLGLAVLGLILFGPDRLPKLAVDAAHFVRKLRIMYANASSDLRSQVGDELKVFDDLREVKKITDLNPKSIVKNQLNSLIEPPTPKIDPDAT